VELSHPHSAGSSRQEIADIIAPINMSFPWQAALRQSLRSVRGIFSKVRVFFVKKYLRQSLIVTILPLLPRAGELFWGPERAVKTGETLPKLF
jgi:hypothetical protein